MKSAKSIGKTLDCLESLVIEISTPICMQLFGGDA